MTATNTNIVDLDADAWVPSTWTCDQEKDHKRGGQFTWDPSRVKLHLFEGQKNGSTMTRDRLKAELRDIPVCNSNMLLFLFRNQHLIPEEFKGKRIFFWGTIYHDKIKQDVFYVTYLFWHEQKKGWLWGYVWHPELGSDEPALAMSA